MQTPKYTHNPDETGFQPQFCDWYNLFSDDQRMLTVKGVQLFVLICASFTVYFNIFHPSPNTKLLWGNRDNDDFKRSFSILNYFFITIYVRNIVVFFSHEHHIRAFVELMFQPCSFFGFWDTFLSILEVELLTHACIERYVVSKYRVFGWPINKKHYPMYVYLSFLFALIYSTPPLYQVGSFSYDFTCSTCTFDLMLPDNWQRYVIPVIFVMRSFKPAMFMIGMLAYAYELETQFDGSMQGEADKYLTHIVVKITCINLMCWIPLAFFKGWVIISQLLFYEVNWVPSENVLLWMIWCHESSGAMSLIAKVVVDGITHYKLFFLPDEDEIVPSEPNKVLMEPTKMKIEPTKVPLDPIQSTKT